MKILENLNLTLNEITNFEFEKLASAPSPTEGRVYYDTTLGRFRFYDGAEWVDLIRRLDQLASATSPVNVGNQRLINVASPTSANDAANKAYVDAARAGLAVKDPVRVRASSNINIATPGTTVDGVAMVSGDSVLLTNQTTASQNGIYVWTGSATALTRRGDADTATNLVPGTYVFVNEGSSADSAWVLTTNGPITLGTTNLTFSLFINAGQTYDGDGLLKIGNQINVVGVTNRISVSADAVDISTNYVGQSSITTLGTISTGTWAATTIAVNRGGTGATTFTANRLLIFNGTTFASSNLDPSAIIQRNTFAVPAGNVLATITHTLNTKRPHVTVYEIATDELVYPGIKAPSTTTVELSFAVAPTAGQYEAVIS